VSGRLMVLAPARMAASTQRRRKSLLGARGVLGPTIQRRRQRLRAWATDVGDHFQNRFRAAPAAMCVTVDGTGGDEGVDPAALGGPDGLGAALDVGDAGPGQAADRALGDDLGNPVHGFEVAVGGDGEARLDHVDPHVLEDLGQLQLLVQGHGGAGRLLAVAHGGVKDDDPVLGVTDRGHALRLIGGVVCRLGHLEISCFAGLLIRSGSWVIP